MFKKTLIAAAATALLAAGSTAALASGPHHGPGPGPVHGGIHFSGPGWSFGFGTPGFHRFPPPRPICQPVFKRISYWHHGHLKTRVIKVGQRCHPVPPHRGPWQAGGPGWGFGW